MTAAEIETLDELEVWLKDQSIEVAVWIAYRAAARVLPFYWRKFAKNTTARDGDLTALPVLRATLISGERTLGASPEIRVASAAAAAHAADAATYAHAAEAAATDAAAADAAAHAAYAAGATTGYSADAATDAAEAAYAAHDADAAAADAAEAAAAHDADYSEKHPVSLDHGLWPGEFPREVRSALEEVLNRLPQPNLRGDHKSAQGSGPEAPDYHSFWIPWYKGLLDGREAFSPALRRDIALIDPEDWDKGDIHINNVVIPALMKEHGATPPIETTTRQMPPASEADIERVRKAMVRHRADLPPTFDALLGYISLEIERLQSRNYRDEDDAAEARRQIGVLSTLHEAVERLQALVPPSSTMPQEDAVEAEKLSRLFIEKFRQWPRDTADELTDKTCRMAILGTTSLMLPMIGVPPTWATAIGLYYVGAKPIAEAYKAAKDLLGGGSTS